MEGPKAPSRHGGAKSRSAEGGGVFSANLFIFSTISRQRQLFHPLFFIHLLPISVHHRLSCCIQKSKHSKTEQCLSLRVILSQRHFYYGTPWTLCKQLIISVRNLHCILLLHITHSSTVNCTLDKVNCTLCVRKHTILSPVWHEQCKTSIDVFMTFKVRRQQSSSLYDLLTISW